jgi:hypothetical protein
MPYRSEASIVPKLRNGIQNRIDFVAVCTCTAILWILFYVGSFPEIFNLGNYGKSIGLLNGDTASIHLADDVMITLRAGMRIESDGFPDFNSTDLSQPSTSYLTPYIFYICLKIFGDFFGVFAYSFIALASYILTCYTVISNSKSRLIGSAIILALALSSTSRSFALNGWDHLFQGLFLTAATFLALRKVTTKYSVIQFCVCILLALLSRPDSLVLVLGVVLTILLRNIGNLKIIVKELLFTLLLYCGFLLLYWENFGHVLSTSVRLKFNSSPSPLYSGIYFFRNGIISYSVISLFCILILICFAFLKLRNQLSLIPIMASILLTGAITTYNSDIFPGGRLYWGATCVLICVVVRELDIPLNVRLPPIHFRPSPSRVKIAILLMTLIALFSSFGSASYDIRSRLLAASVNDLSQNSSPTAKQYLITMWMNKNLLAEDGAIGIYYLGMAYHLPNFEIADFLGKADEMIAGSKVQWGPPGHNKWNTSRTLAKWKPQAIIPPANMAELTMNQARERKRVQADWGFGPDLKLNSTIIAEYSYCFIKDGFLNQKDYFGFYIKNNLRTKLENQLECKPT